jgi:ketol-acid reductoisomerase
MVIGKASRKAMKKMLKDVESGKFAKEWIKEYKSGCKNFNKLREKGKKEPIEIVGAEIRALFEKK